MSLHLLDWADKSGGRQIEPIGGEWPTAASAIASIFAAS
jgi:hypothetical protein